MNNEKGLSKYKQYSILLTLINSLQRPSINSASPVLTTSPKLPKVAQNDGFLYD